MATRESTADRGLVIDRYSEALKKLREH